MKSRARQLGIPLEGTPGPNNAITDVRSVEVGFATLIEESDIRTGVTAIHPRGKFDHMPVFGGVFSFNGNGEMTGAAWVDEGGFLEGPVMLTNTHSVGVVRDSVIDWQVRNHCMFQKWALPVVAETADGWLNDMNGFHVRPEHVWQALDTACGGPVAEGNVGGGTGNICYEFKGGTGTASQSLPDELGSYTVGVLVQANFGRRHQLMIAGVPIGHFLTDGALFTSGVNPFGKGDSPCGEGSIIIVVATDAPLLPHQLRRLARRATLGMARTGSMGGNGSGDIFIAFSTANHDAAAPASGLANLQALCNDRLDPLFMAAVLATEEAILNALLAAETMVGRDGLVVPALDHSLLRDVLQRYNRLLPVG